jgi:hypothetical protein
MCVVPARTIGQVCQLRGAKNRRCAAGLVCASGRCLGLLNATGCSTNNTLCDGDLVCRVDTCLPVGALTDTCDEDDDCGDTLVCTSGACAPDCTPDCTGLVCGDDGCGGSCGTCGAGETCTAGACLCTGEVCDTVNGEGCCDGQCIDMTANFDHCGGCWASCEYGKQYCADSTCHDYCAGNVGTTHVTMNNRLVTGAYESAASYNEPLAYIPGGSVSCFTDADCTKCAELIGTNVTNFGIYALVTDCGCHLGRCNDEDVTAARNSETCKVFHNNPTF